jgi:hypothetical protein
MGRASRRTRHAGWRGCGISDNRFANLDLAHFGCPRSGNSRRGGRIIRPVTPPLNAVCTGTKHAIDARPPYTQPAGDFRGPDALRLQSGYLSNLPTGGRHTALIAPLPLGLGDPLALALQHALTFCLPYRSDDAQHQAAGARARVEGLAAGDRQNPKADLLGFQPCDDHQQVATDRASRSSLVTQKQSPSRT